MTQISCRRKLAHQCSRKEHRFWHSAREGSGKRNSKEKEEAAVYDLGPSGSPISSCVIIIYVNAIIAFDVF